MSNSSDLRSGILEGFTPRPVGPKQNMNIRKLQPTPDMLMVPGMGKCGQLNNSIYEGGTPRGKQLQGKGKPLSGFPSISEKKATARPRRNRCSGGKTNGDGLSRRQQACWKIRRGGGAQPIQFIQIYKGAPKPKTKKTKKKKGGGGGFFPKGFSMIMIKKGHCGKGGAQFSKFRTVKRYTLVYNASSTWRSGRIRKLACSKL